MEYIEKYQGLPTQIGERAQGIAQKKSRKQKGYDRAKEGLFEPFSRIEAPVVKVEVTIKASVLPRGQSGLRKKVSVHPGMSDGMVRYLRENGRIK